MAGLAGLGLSGGAWTAAAVSAAVAVGGYFGYVELVVPNAQTPEVQSLVTSTESGIAISGSARADSAVSAYIDKQLVATAQSDKEGLFTLTLDVAPAAMPRSLKLLSQFGERDPVESAENPLIAPEESAMLAAVSIANPAPPLAEGSPADTILRDMLERRLVALRPEDQSDGNGGAGAETGDTPGAATGAGEDGAPTAAASNDAKLAETEPATVQTADEGRAPGDAGDPPRPEAGQDVAGTPAPDADRAVVQVPAGTDAASGGDAPGTLTGADADGTPGAGDNPPRPEAELAVTEAAEPGAGEAVAAGTGAPDRPLGVVGTKGAAPGDGAPAQVAGTAPPLAHDPAGLRPAVGPASDLAAPPLGERLVVRLPGSRAAVRPPPLMPIVAAVIDRAPRRVQGDALLRAAALQLAAAPAAAAEDGAPATDTAAVQDARVAGDSPGQAGQPRSGQGPQAQTDTQGLASVSAAVSATGPDGGTAEDVAPDVAEVTADVPDIATGPEPAAPGAADRAAPVELASVAPDRPAASGVSIDTISYDAEGLISLAGRAGEGQVRVFLDNRPIQTAGITNDGQWVAELPQVDTRVYQLKVVEVSQSGEVISETTTPFKPESREELERQTAKAVQQDDIFVVVVQPGFTLWRIARENYGEGNLYPVVFAANRDKISDPDLIYPGQIFTVPDSDTVDGAVAAN